MSTLSIGALNNAKIRVFSIQGLIRARRLSAAVFASTALNHPALTSSASVFNPFSDFKGADLRYQQLFDLNFAYFNFGEADLRKCYFKNSILEGAIFNKAVLAETSFRWSSLRGVNLSQIRCLGKIDLRSAELKNCLINGDDLKYIILGSEEERVLLGDSGGVETEVLDCLMDLTRLAKDGKLDPLLCREAEIDRLVQILLRKTKCNPVLIGEAGVGKTALVEGLAQKIAEGKIPELGDKRIVSLDVAKLLAGTKLRGQFEERMKKVLGILREDPNIILFIDELHGILKAGKGENSDLNAGNILKPALSRGEIKCLGATTYSLYRKYIEKDGALERRFAPVLIEEPTLDETLEILRGIKNRYEEFHGVRIEAETLEAIVKLSDRYLMERYFPDKAIDIMDEACARVKILNSKKLFGDCRNFPVVGVEIVEQIISEQTGIPAVSLKADEKKKLLRMEKDLGRVFAGQAGAVKKVCAAIRSKRAGFGSSRKGPISFLFLGPTGAGKSQLAKALAKLLFNSNKNLITLDMSELMEKDSVSKLLGAPPGQIGHEEGGGLVNQVRRKPYSIVLCEGIENAHESAINILCQALEEGTLTDTLGRKAHFKNTIVIMTSNLGELSFQQKFSPEFINRIGEVCVFSFLSKNSLKKITRILLADEKQKVCSQTGLQLEFSKSLIGYIVKKGYSKEAGAKNIKKIIQTEIIDKLAEEILKGTLEKGDKLLVGVVEEKIGFSRK